MHDNLHPTFARLLTDWTRRRFDRAAERYEDQLWEERERDREYCPECGRPLQYDNDECNGHCPPCQRRGE